MARSDVNNALRQIMADVAMIPASGGSALVGFLQSGTGATARTSQAKMRETVSVKDFGAVGDGVTDDTAAINAALTASRNVKFPAGNYIVSTGITMTTSHSLLGDGMDRTTITGSGNMDVIYFNAASSSDHGFVIRDMTITNSTAVASQSSGSGIRMNNAYVWRIDNVKVSGCFNGITTTLSGLSTITKFFTVNCKTSAVSFTTSYDIRLCQFELTGPSVYGIKLQDFCDEHAFSDGVVSSVTTALYTDATVYSVSQRPEFCRFSNVSFDACTNGLNLGNCTDMVFANCFISNRPNDGVSLGNRGTVENIQFIGTTVFNNGGHGINVGSTATHTDFIGCKIISNSQTSVGIQHGILINGASDFKVIGCTFFNGWGLATGQNYGLYIAAAGCDRFVVAGNKFGTGGGQFINSSTSADQQIYGNIGYIGGTSPAVTQATSKATGVTLNRLGGAITTNAAALAATTDVSFTLTNSTIGVDDQITVWRKSGGTAGAYAVSVDSVAAGSCVITLRNKSGGSLSEAPVIGFTVIKAATV